MAIGAKLKDHMDDAVEMQDMALKSMDNLSTKFDELAGTTSDIKRMLFEKKSGMPELRRIMHTFKEIQMRTARIGEFSDDPEMGIDYDAYMDYLENDVGEYIQNADRELSWVHGMVSP